MVNIIDANKKFYPTDHCGYIRILIDDIIPEFLAMALEVEGKLEKFSRANRASTDRIRKISVFVPEDINEQKRILKIGKQGDAKSLRSFIRKTDAPSHAYFREIEQGVLWELGLCSLNG